MCGTPVSTCTVPTRLVSAPLIVIAFVAVSELVVFDKLAVVIMRHAFESTVYCGGGGAGKDLHSSENLRFVPEKLAGSGAKASEIDACPIADNAVTTTYDDVSECIINGIGSAL